MLEMQQTFGLPAGFTWPQLLNALAQQVCLTEPVESTRDCTFFDTFDWRLYQKSWVLYHTNGALCQRKLYHSRPARRLPLDIAPCFAADLPAGPLKTLLAPVIEARALLPQAQVTIHAVTCRVLNSDQKTVARLAIEAISKAGSGGDAPTPVVQLIPVRGYAKAATQLAGFLAAQGLTPLVNRDQFLAALAAVGNRPGAYSARLDLQLAPAMPAAAAAQAIHRRLVQIIRANETGIKQDLDPEFLHDFRVAIRRARAALSQIAAVFPAGVVEQFKQEFAAIARATNNLRDLDVYLLSEPRYREMLPALLRDDIAPLFACLRRKRAAALEQTIDQLDSAAYAQTLRNWETFLIAPPLNAPDAPAAAQPVLGLACRQIYRRYRRIIKLGRPSLKSAQAEQLHDLRIECKKLRYLLEFFAGLFPPAEIGLLVKQLKKLQDNLGDFNDLSVQEQYLLHLAAELPAAETGERQTLLALGCLIGALDQKRARAQGEFAQIFAAFAAKETRQQFKTLFAGQKNEAAA